MDIITATYEQLLDERENANHIVEEAKATLNVINQEILDRLKKEKLQGKVVGDWGVSIVNRVSYTKVSLETAESFGCTKQAIDTAKLGKLYKTGVPIEGATEYEYVRVTQVNKDDSDQA